VAQFAVLTAGLVFIVSATLLTGYAGGGTGVSLLKAATNDPASALMPANFWISVGLAALAFGATVASIILDSRPLMIGTAVVSLGLTGYALYIPRAVAGFVPGPSYWISLVAAAAMAVAAAVAAAALSPPTRITGAMLGAGQAGRVGEDHQLGAVPGA
jgi:hypothetical protein